MRQYLNETHPQLAAELVDPTLATKISRGSTKKVVWRCELGHTWEAAPNSRTAMGSGCPVCAGKVVVPGFNDLSSANPELAAQLADPSLGQTLTPKSGKKVQWRCTEGHLWSASVNTRANGHGCPVCTGKRVDAGDNDLTTTHPETTAKLADPKLGRTVTAHSSKVLEWVCDEDHHWQAPVARIVGGAGCPYCSGLKAYAGQTDMATTHPELAAQLVDPQLGRTLKARSNKKVTWRCDRGHTWEASPNNQTGPSGRGCPVCSNRVVLAGFNDLATTHPELTEQMIGDPTKVSYGSRTLVQWRCQKGHTWSAQPNWRTASGSGCPSCAASAFVSRGESEVAEIIRALVPEMTVRTSVRDLIRGELDIVVDQARLAVEFNGVWWHSEAHLSQDYHAAKTAAVAAAGHRLIHIWADDWEDRRELVVRALAHRLEVTHRLLQALPGIDPMLTERVGARTLNAEPVDAGEARRFLEANHLQGAVGSTYRFGLRDDQGRLRALLGVGRKNHGSRVNPEDGTWDVQRYATAGIVPGGFSRLLSYAQQQMLAAGEQMTLWTSYSDDDLSEGGMYQAAGFTANKRQRPSYSYIGAQTKWKRAHRTNFTRGRFETDPTLVYEPGWTEHQAAQANGLYRVYDAGKTRWVRPVE